MDILVSSNLERLLFDLSGENDAAVKGYMDALASTGKYEVSDAIKAAWRSSSGAASATRPAPPPPSPSITRRTAI